MNDERHVVFIQVLLVGIFSWLTPWDWGVDAIVIGTLLTVVAFLGR